MQHLLSFEKYSDAKSQKKSQNVFLLILAIFGSLYCMKMILYENDGITFLKRL